jgi:hypothetical protein
MMGRTRLITYTNILILSKTDQSEELPIILKRKDNVAQTNFISLSFLSFQRKPIPILSPTTEGTIKAWKVAGDVEVFSFIYLFANISHKLFLGNEKEKQVKWFV